MASTTSDVETSPAIPAFTTTIAVPLHCQSCIDDVSRALSGVEGVQTISPSLSTQTVAIHGTAAPSAILSALHATGRPAILRGSGIPDSAAVAILETYDGSHELQLQVNGPTSIRDGQRVEMETKEKMAGRQDQQARKEDTAAPDHQVMETRTLKPSSTPVRGLVRLVQVSSSHSLLDIGVSNLPEGRWRARLRCAGDVSRGLIGMGEVWDARESGHSKVLGEATGELGDLRVGGDGRGAVVLVREMKVPEVVGRGFSLERIGEWRPGKKTGEDEGGNHCRGENEEENHDEAEVQGDFTAQAFEGGEKKEKSQVIMGVVARSAGAWENEKIVCACSGKTVWEEREEQLGRGMI